MTPPRYRRRAVALLLVAGLASCSSPLARQSELDLQRSVIESVRRELAPTEPYATTRVMEREVMVPTLGIKPEFMSELEAMAGPQSYDPAVFPMNEDLTGQTHSRAFISLERAIRSAAANNLQVQFQRLAPAINEAQVVAAQAAFDWVLFGQATAQLLDEPRPVEVSSFPPPGGFPDRTADERQVYNVQTGLRRQTISGGQFSVQQDLDQTDINTPGVRLNPGIQDQVAITARYDQPLLRGFGSDVALSQVRLARNAERTEVARLKTQLLNTIGDTETAYWQLVQAHRDLLILERLLERGQDTRDKVEKRRNLDATPAQIANANSQVQTRRANVMRAQNTFRQAGDRLKALMNDPGLPVGSEVLLVPVDMPVDAPVQFNLLDSLNQAVQERPEVQQAILSIDDTSIRQVVADNARLPQLDLRLQAKFIGLNNNFGEGYADVVEGKFIDYLVGFIFERPLGNRQREAQYMVRRLEREQAVLAYRNTVQSVAGEVKRSLYDATTNYRLIEQTRAARYAAAEDLRAFRIEISVLSGYTVVNLDQELRRQEALAQAERDEVSSLTDYMNSLARLYTATGTSLERNGIIFKVPDAPVGDRD
ncbi:MAG: TolC family protein [Phycisphaerales bacterium]|nr:TolC family protein [Phycisphaerales bacterium]